MGRNDGYNQVYPTTIEHLLICKLTLQPLRGELVLFDLIAGVLITWSFTGYHSVISEHALPYSGVSGTAPRKQDGWTQR